MAIPLNYIARNLWTRRLTTALTAGGMALVIFVFATVQMLDAGLTKTLVSTGEPDNAVVIRKGAETEIQSRSTTSRPMRSRCIRPSRSAPTAGRLCRRKRSC